MLRYIFLAALAILGPATVPAMADTVAAGERLTLQSKVPAFRYNAERYPQSANVWDSLGDALDGAGKKEEALASYRKAVSLAEASNDPNLEVFKKQVARLTVATKPDEH